MSGPRTPVYADAEDNSCPEPKAVLPVSGVIGQIRQNIIGLDGAQCEMAGETEIDASAERRRQSIRSDTRPVGIGKVSVEAMHAADHRLREGNQPAPRGRRVAQAEEISGQAKPLLRGVERVSKFRLRITVSSCN